MIPANFWRIKVRKEIFDGDGTDGWAIVNNQCYSDKSNGMLPGAEESNCACQTTF